MPQTRGPGFPGAQASNPLSRLATSPLRRVSRHPFRLQVFQRAAFPCGCALSAVPDLLGSRARFRALCLTPRFFEPRCRRTNSAISLLDARAYSSNSYPRPHRHGVATFPPNIGHPKGRKRATEFLVGLHPDTYASEPELQRPDPEGNGDEFAWAERPK